MRGPGAMGGVRLQTLTRRSSRLPFPSLVLRLNLNVGRRLRGVEFSESAICCRSIRASTAGLGERPVRGRAPRHLRVGRVSSRVRAADIQAAVAPWDHAGSDRVHRAAQICRQNERRKTFFWGSPRIKCAEITPNWLHASIGAVSRPRPEAPEPLSGLRHSAPQPPMIRADPRSAGAGS